MSEYPSAIKRPVIEAGRETLVIGFDPVRYEAVLAGRGNDGRMHTRSAP